MSKSYCYEHPRPSVTVDTLAFSLDGPTLKVLLVRRKGEPFAGSWAIPGGFVEIDEPVEAAARRELLEETGLAEVGPLRLVGVFSDPGRDPRGRTISLVHLGLVPSPAPAVVGADDASEAAWHPAPGAKGLAFDHDAIVGLGLSLLSEGLDRGPACLGLLPEEFSASAAKDLFVALGRPARSAIAWLRSRSSAGEVAGVEGSKSAYRKVATRDGLDRGIGPGRIGL